MKRVLCIDGGGIRGLIPALVCAEIERRTGRRIGECFDLIAGTSTGGILALGFSKKGPAGTPAYSAAELVEIYERRGKDIFARSLWRGVSSVAGMLDETYSHQGLEGVLAEYFGADTLGSGVTRTLVTSYDIEKREPLFFKSWKHEHAAVEMRHVARATSAAPTYFEPARVPVFGEPRSLVDGGVFVNNPTVSAYAEARRLFGNEEIFVVSLGTGELTRRIEHDEAKDWGKAGWLVPLLHCMFDGVSDAADYQMRQLLEGSYVRLQTTLEKGLDDMDNVTRSNLESLRLDAGRMLAEQAGLLDRIVNQFV